LGTGERLRSIPRRRTLSGGCRRAELEGGDRRAKPGEEAVREFPADLRARRNAYSANHFEVAVDAAPRPRHKFAALLTRPRVGPHAHDVSGLVELEPQRHPLRADAHRNLNRMRIELAPLELAIRVHRVWVPGELREVPQSRPLRDVPSRVARYWQQSQ
jgi:hypothetical protein